MDSELRQETPQEKAEIGPTAKKATRTGILIVLVSIFLALAFFFYNFQFVIVSGESMFPTLASNERILICKALWALGQPAHGDIVVLDTENGFIIKRVAYLSGEEVPTEDRPFEWPLHPNFVVPSGFVYVLGDNARASEDSRDFGPVRVDHIVGKAVWAK